MTGLSNYSALNLLNYITGIQSMPALPAAEYLALFIAVGSDSGGALVEPSSGVGYQRTQIAGTLLTTSLTSSGSAVLNITGVPSWIQVGMLASDITSPSSIPSSSFVIAKGTNSITLSNILPGVASGNSIRLTSFGIQVSGTASSPYSITNGAPIPFPQATGPGYGSVPAFGIYDASGIGQGNLLTWDFFGLYDWAPFFSSSGVSASGAIFQQSANGYSNGNGVILSAEFGGTLPTAVQGAVTGYALNYVANHTTNAYTLSSSPTAPSSGNAVWTSNAGNGQARRVDVINIPGGVQETIPPNSLYLSIFSTFGAQPTGAASQLTPSGATVSTLESGMMVYVTAWGGNEFGFSYNYSLGNDAPSGVTIDKNTAVISIPSGLPLGANSFTIIVNNQKNSFLQATFPFTLNVLQGITSGTPTSGQILHKTYDPLGGAFGSPTGTVFTNVFNNIQTQIKADQLSFLEGHLRCTIPLRKSQLYQYTNNRWWDGLQYYSMTLDPAFSSSGTNPRMQNISTDSGQVDPYSDGPMTYGHGSPQFAGAGIKSHAALIGTIPMGSVSATIISGAAFLIPGRVHQLIGSVQQMNGEPPNSTYVEYVTLLSVSGNVATWDRPTRYRYAQDWWEFFDDISLGRARLMCFDCGSGQSNAGFLSTPRAGQRGLFQHIQFLDNPNAPGPNGNGDIMSVANQVMLTYDDCNVWNPQPTVSKNVGYYNCALKSPGDLDKQMETLLFVNCSGQVEMGGATGAQWLYTAQCFLGCWQVSPRQWRSENTMHNASGDTVLDVPIGISFQGPVMEMNFNSGCSFIPGVFPPPIWMFGNNPYGQITLGSDVIVSGTQYQLKNTASNFETWIDQAYEGMIVTLDGNPPYGDSPWGYIATLASDLTDGGSLYMNINWVSGVAPTTGTFYANARFREMNVASGAQFLAGCLYNSGNFVQEHVNGHGTSYNYPTGYPTTFPTYGAR